LLRRGSCDGTGGRDDGLLALFRIDRIRLAGVSPRSCFREDSSVDFLTRGQAPPVLSAGDLWFLSNGKEWYFTRLATNNPQRQFIWHRKTDDPGTEPRLVLRMEKGSLRQIALSPDGQWAAATHLWRVGEERILVFPLAAPEKYRYLTPELRVAFSPTWAADGKSLLFSMQEEGSQADFDLQRVSVDDARIEPLKRIEGSSEWFPSQDSSGRWVFFEQNREGRSSLGALDTTTGKVVAIPLPHQGREPFWVSKIAP
jgi:Tol biopolymer transport system component